MFRVFPTPLSQLGLRLIHFILEQKPLSGMATPVERGASVAANSTEWRGRSSATRPGKSAWRPAATLLAAGAGLAAGVYGAYVAVTWFRYGRVGRSTTGESDQLIDRFMPAYEVVDRHQIRVHAPAAATLATAREVELFQLPLVRAIVRGRELILGAPSDDRPRPRGLLAEMQALGWVVLAERPEREIVVGAVTRPWEPQVTFRSLPPEAFAAFDEPDYVKIVWTLRTDPVGDDRTIFTTETRVVATDSKARATFRRYWAVFSPGITLIRQLALRQVKAAAEQRGRRIRRPARHPA